LGLEGVIADHASRSYSSREISVSRSTIAYDGDAKLNERRSVSSALPRIAFQRVKGRSRSVSARRFPVPRKRILLKLSRVAFG